MRRIRQRRFGIPTFRMPTVRVVRSQTGGGGGSVPEERDNVLLLENGGFLLLENGGAIKLENQ